MGLRKHNKKTPFQFEEKLIKLTKKQRFFIKKYAVGTPFNEIKNELCFDCEYKYLCFQNEIKEKLDIKSDEDLLHEAHKLNIVTVNDYFIANHKHIAFGIAYNLYEKNKDNKFNCGTLEDIYKKILHVNERLIIQSKLK